MEYDPDFVKIPPQATAQRKHRPSLYFNPEKVIFVVTKEPWTTVHFGLVSDSCLLCAIGNI